MNNPVQPAAKLVFDKKMIASLPVATQKALDGIELEIAFDFDTIAHAEDEMKRPLLTGLTEQELSRPTISFVRAMLYQSLRIFHPGITYDEAAVLVTAKTFRAIWAAVLTAYVEAIRDDEEEEADPTQDQG